jgi:hypothetical protein
LQDIVPTALAHLTVLLLAATKWMLAAFLELSGDNRVWASALRLWLGGMGGVVLYTFLGRWLFGLWQRVNQAPAVGASGETRKVRFSRLKRFIIRVRQAHGLAGIAVLTPIVLTVPIGTVAANLLEPRRGRVLVYMSLAFGFWTLFLCLLDFGFQWNLGPWFKSVLRMHGG